MLSPGSKFTFSLFIISLRFSKSPFSCYILLFQKKGILNAPPFMNNEGGNASFFLERSLKLIKHLHMRMKSEREF